MYYDLNINWPGSVSKLNPVLDMATKIGYQVIAVNFTAAKIKGTSSPLTAEVMNALRESYPKLEILRRLTVILDDNTKNQSFASLATHFDLVAVQPSSERALQSAATALDVDLISLDMTTRSSFYLRHKIACAAVDRGVRFEICYGQAITSPDARRHTISNAASIIRATRSRGLVLSSGADSSFSLRAPSDVINLACVWGLNSQAAHQALDKQCAAAVVNGKLRNTSAKQVVEAVANPVEPVEPPAKKQKI